MPSLDIEIDWPAEGNPDSPPGVAQTFTAFGTIIVDDETKRGTTYKVYCRLFKGSVEKTPSPPPMTALFDPTTSPNWHVDTIQTNAVGPHLLRAELIDTTTSSVLDYDEETIDIVASGGRSNREIEPVITED